MLTISAQKILSQLIAKKLEEENVDATTVVSSGTPSTLGFEAPGELRARVRADMLL
jgi:hypothetical protein